MRRALGLAVGAALLGTGCGGGLEPTADGGGAATIVAEIDTAFFCDIPEVVDVVLSATAVGCLDEDEGCVVEDVEGTMLTCPAASPTALLAVDLQHAGRYRVGVTAHATTRDDLELCFATAAGASTFEVSAVHVDDGAQIPTARDPQTCAEN